MKWWIYILCLTLGCATVRDAGEACDTYVAHELGEAFKRVETYRDEGFQPHLIGEARGALERARQALYGEPMLREAAVCPLQHQRRTSWKDLRDDYETANALVAELEEARGVRFVEFADGSPLWVDATTGKPIPRDFADSI